MTRLEWPRAGVLPPDPANPGPYAGGLSRADLATVHSALIPLLRVLLLTGYEVPGFSTRMPGGGWVQLDRYDLTVSETAGTAPVTAKWDGPTVAIEAVPILDARDRLTSMAIDVDPRDEGTGWHRDRDAALLYVGYHDPAADLGRANDVLRGLEASAKACVDAIVADASDRLDTQDWSAWSPVSGVGLFWLLDPAWWRADVLGGTREPSPAGRALEEFGTQLRVVRENAPGYDGYFDARLTGVRAATRLPVFFRRENQLVSLMRVVVGEFFQVPGRVGLFFDHLRAWLDEIGERDRLDDATLEALQGAPWFEVLVTLVDVGVFTPAPIVGILPPSGGDVPEPVEAVRWSLDVVELRVLGQLSIWLRRVRGPDGVPIPQESLPADVPDEDPALLEPIGEFTWDFLIPVDGTLPVLYLVAAPGVAIDIPATPVPDGWRYEIVRVPDAALVPEWGTAVSPYWLMPRYVVSAADTVEAVVEGTVVGDGPGESRQPGAAAAVQILSMPRGVVLSYPVYETGRGDPALSVEISLSDEAARSGDVRYATDVFFYRDTRFPEPVPYLSVWTTPGVDVAVRRVVSGLEDLDPWGALSCHVWEVGDYRDVPEFGVPLPFDPAAVEGFPFAGGEPQYLPDWPAVPAGPPLPAGRFRLLDVETLDLPWWVYLTADIAIGMLPVVGDALDLVEFVTALSVGVDRWGRPVTNVELMLMGAGVLTPFVSAPLVRGMARDAGGLFGGGMSRRTRPPLSPISYAEVREISSRSVKLAELDPADQILVEAELATLSQFPITKIGEVLRGEFLRPGDLGNAVKQADNFLPGSSEVLLAYRHWQSRHPKGSFRAFIADRRAGARGRVRAIIEALCGNDVSVGEKTLRTPSAVRRWKSVDPTVRADPPSQEYLVANLPGLIGMVEDHVATRPRPMLWVAEGLLEVSDALPDSGNPQVYADRVRSLLASLSCGNGPDDLTLAQLKLLIGAKRVHLSELARLLVTGIDLLTHDLHERATTGFPGVPVHRVSIDEVLPVLGGPTRPVTGIHKFFGTLVTAAAPENAARFEVLMIAEELRKGTPPRMLRAGVTGSGVSGAGQETLQGPDLLRYRVEAGETVADILQGKSFNSINALFATTKPEHWFRRNPKPPPPGAPPKPPSKPWAGPEVFAQTVKDLVRMAQVVPQYTVEGPAAETALDCPDLPGEPVRFSGQIEFFLDFAYYYRNRSTIPPDPSPAYQGRLAELRAMSFKKLRTVPDLELRTYLDDLRASLDAEQIYALLTEHVVPVFTGQIQDYLELIGPLLYDDGGLELPWDLDVELTVHVL